MKSFLIHRTILGFCILVCASNSTWAGISPGAEPALVQIESSGEVVIDETSLSIPSSVLLAASDPAGHEALSIDETQLADLTLSFALSTSVALPENAEAFLQGSGISLALVTLPEGEAIAAFDSSEGVEGDWIYGLIPVSDTEGHLLAITFSPDAQTWSVSAAGLSLLSDLPRDLLSLAQPLTFFGSTTSDVSITALTGTYPPEQEELEQEKYRNSLAKAKTLREMNWKPKTKMVKSNGIWEYGENLFEQRLTSFSSEILDAPIEKLVFVDNLNGDDENNGHYPTYLNGKNGPVASMEQALELSGEGKILIFLPGDGYYSHKDISPKEGTEMIAMVGHLTLAATGEETNENQ